MHRLIINFIICFFLTNVNRVIGVKAINFIALR